MLKMSSSAFRSTIPQTQISLFSLFLLSFILQPYVIVRAQEVRPPASPTGRTHIVSVGRRGDDLALRFTPEETVAQVGDLVQFQFYPVNHSVAAADFLRPCVPLDVESGRSFFSGFQPLPPNTDTLTSFTIIVTTPDPIFFYCTQGRHCQQGFVGVVNPTDEKSLNSFRAAAALAPENLSPGEIPRQLPLPVPAPSVSGDPVPKMDNRPSNSTESIPGPSSRANEFDPVKNIGAIVGGVLGGVIFIALLSGMILICRKRKRQSAELVAISSRGADIEGKGNMGTGFRGVKASQWRGGARDPGSKKRLEISRPSLVEPADLMRESSRPPVTGLIPIATPQVKSPSPQLFAPVAIRGGAMSFARQNTILPASAGGGGLENYDYVSDVAPLDLNGQSEPRASPLAPSRGHRRPRYQENPLGSFSGNPQSDVGLTRGYTMIAASNPYMLSNFRPTYNSRNPQLSIPTASIYTSDAYTGNQIPKPRLAVSRFNDGNSTQDGSMVMPI